MQSLIVTVWDKGLTPRLNDFCRVVYISKFLPIIGVEIEDDKVGLLKKDENIVSFRRAREGAFNS